MKQITIIAIASALGGLLLGACIFRKAEGGPSPVQLLQLLAQATNCWASSGGNVTTSCSVTVNGRISASSIGIGGTTPDSNTMLAVNGRISSSVLGVYCGKTASTYNGAQVGGYTGAKLKCEATCSSTLAHMCSAHEMLMSLQQGQSIPFALWYAWGGTSPGAIADCAAFTSVVGTDQGFIWSGTQFTTTTCPNSYSIACCL